MGVEQNRGEGTQRFLKGGQAGSRGGWLKKWGGTGTPLQTMVGNDKKKTGTLKEQCSV